MIAQLHTEYSHKEGTAMGDIFITDIVDPPTGFLPAPSAFFEVDGDHCRHAEFDPGGYRYIDAPFDDNLPIQRRRYINVDPEWKDNCCRHDDCWRVI